MNAEDIQIEHIYQEIEELLSDKNSNIAVFFLEDTISSPHNPYRKIQIDDTTNHVAYILTTWDQYNIGYVFKRTKTESLFDGGRAGSWAAIDESYTTEVHRRTAILLNKWQPILTLIEDRTKKPIWPEWWEKVS